MRAGEESRAAFTLLEVLVVVACLGLLAAFLLPVLAAARGRAHRTRCLSQVRSLAQAQLLYAHDWEEALPPWYRREGARVVLWTELFWPYVREERVYRCPRFQWPDSPAPGRHAADYALMTWGPHGDGSEARPYWRWAGNMSLAQVARPTETFNLMDGFTTDWTTHGFLPRHAGGMNAAYLDGHAGWLTPDRAYRKDRAADGRWFYRYIAADVEG